MSIRNPQDDLLELTATLAQIYVDVDFPKIVPLAKAVYGLIQEDKTAEVQDFIRDFERNNAIGMCDKRKARTVLCQVLLTPQGQKQWRFFIDRGGYYARWIRCSLLITQQEQIP